MASSSSSPCAACKFLRRKCVPGCVFAPYFPQEDTARFVSVHRAFGASNVAKILADLSPNGRRDAVISLCNEADILLQDPVNGCAGYVQHLQNEQKLLRDQVSAVRAEIAKYLNSATPDTLRQTQLLPFDPLNFSVPSWGIHQDMPFNLHMDGMSFNVGESASNPETALALAPQQIDLSARQPQYFDEQRQR